MQLRGHRRAALVVEVHVDEHRAAGEDVLWLEVRGVAGDGPGLEGADEEPAALGEGALAKADGTGATCRGCLGARAVRVRRHPARPCNWIWWAPLRL